MRCLSIIDRAQSLDELRRVYLVVPIIEQCRTVSFDEALCLVEEMRRHVCAGNAIIVNRHRGRFGGGIKRVGRVGRVDGDLDAWRVPSIGRFVRRLAAKLAGEKAFPSRAATTVFYSFQGNWVVFPFQYFHECFVLNRLAPCPSGNNSPLRSVSGGSKAGGQT